MPHENEVCSVSVDSNERPHQITDENGSPGNSPPGHPLQPRLCRLPSVVLAGRRPMHTHRLRMLPLLLLAALAGAPLAAVAQMPSRPPYLTFKSFSSHPMKCPSTKPLWAR